MNWSFAMVWPAISILTHWHIELARTFTLTNWERGHKKDWESIVQRKYLATTSIARPPETSRSPGRWWRPSILAHLSNASPGLSSTVSPNNVNSCKEEHRARRQCPPDTSRTCGEREYNQTCVFEGLFIPGKETWDQFSPSWRWEHGRPCDGPATLGDCVSCLNTWDSSISYCRVEHCTYFA